MKKVILSAVMVLALAGASVFAATPQNKNMGSKPAASSGKKMGGKKHHKKRHRKARRGARKSANKNM